MRLVGWVVEIITSNRDGPQMQGSATRSRGVGNHGEEHSGKQSKEKLNKSHVGAQDGHWKDLGLKIHHPSQEAPEKHIAFRDGIGTARS